MSQAISVARRGVAAVGSHLKQKNLLSASQGLRDGVYALLTQQLLKGEREELSDMVRDAVANLGNDRNLRRIFPLSLEYKAGEEKALLDNLDELLSILSEDAVGNAREMMGAMEARNKSLLDKGQSELDQGAHDEARGTFALLAEANPSDGDLRADIGSRFLKAGLLEDAVEHLSSAADMDGNTAYAYNHLGIAFRRMSRFELAEDSFNKALAIDAHDPNIYFNMGRLYLDWQKWKEAATAGIKALELAPDFAEAGKLAEYAKKRM